MIEKENTAQKQIDKQAEDFKKVKRKVPIGYNKI